MLFRSMVRIDVFHIEDDGYYFVPIYTADTVKAELPQKAVVAHKPVDAWKEMRDSDFLFSLYPGDLIQITSRDFITLNLDKDLKKHGATGEPILKRKEWMVYYVKAGIGSGSIAVKSHDGKYNQLSQGIKTLLSIEKYEVDPLGEYHKIHIPEKRQTFR